MLEPIQATPSAGLIIEVLPSRDSFRMLLEDLLLVLSCLSLHVHKVTPPGLSFASQGQLWVRC